MTDGIILIDKPAGMTSFGVVARLRRVLSQQAEGKGATRAADSLRARSDERGPHETSFVGLGEGKPSVVPHKRQRVKVGHTGTLDPFATGLMILVVGKECKNAGQYTKLDKIYEATIKLGQTSTTGDTEGTLTAVSDTVPTLERVTEAVKGLTGEIQQRPPIFSAIKVNGQRAYKLARNGQEVEIPLRTVSVYSLDILAYTYPELKIRAHVSSGTYIRTLASDLGAALGTGAYCQALRRVRIADYDIADARILADFDISD